MLLNLYKEINVLGDKNWQLSSIHIKSQYLNTYFG